MTTRDGSDAPDDEGALASQGASAPGADDETVSTLTGLFRMARSGSSDPADDAAAVLDEAEAALDRYESDESDETDPQQSEETGPPTESIRLLSEMFGGFRRGRSDASSDGLEEVLGTATQSLPVIDDGRVIAQSSRASEPVVAAPESETPDPPAEPAPSAEPPLTAGAIPIVGGDREATPPITRPREGETPVAPPADARTEPIAQPAEPTRGRPSAERVSTAYVPKDPENETETALAWLSADKVATGQIPVAAASPALQPARRRRAWVFLAPFLTAVALVVAYVATFALWPLSNVEPTVAEPSIEAPTAAPLEMPWPQVGQAAVSVEGVDGILSPATAEAPETPVSMASLTKVITVMTILEKQPLELGEQGPSYEFGYADYNEYWAYRYNNESALDVPIGGTLTQYQMLEGILLGSASNYVNKLVDQIWEYDREAFTLDAVAWLNAQGIDDVSVVEATGISLENLGTASSLVRIADIAMQHPVVAEIVAKQQTELPGAGIVENSNPLMGEEGIVGIKTGAIFPFPSIWNLMTAKDVENGSGEPVRVYSVVLGQETEDGRADVSRQLLDAVTQALQPQQVVEAGEVIATVTTPWGESTQVIVDDAVDLVLWDGETADLSVDYSAGLGVEAGEEAGVLTVSGALGEASTTLSVTDDLDGPSFGWRLSHPLELLGLAPAA